MWEIDRDSHGSSLPPASMHSTSGQEDPTVILSLEIRKKKKRGGEKKVEGQMSRHSSPARFLKPTPDGIKKDGGSHITVKSKDFPRLCRGADQECETKKSMISPRPTGRESSYPVPWLCIQSSSVCEVQSTWRGVSISRSKSDLLTNPTQRFQ